MNSPSWRVHVLGRAELESPDGTLTRPERKLAACLSYLALEGATSRAQLVGLLWPDSPEATARNNLSQLLRKLRLATGADLVTGADLLELAPQVWVDAAQLREAATAGRLAELIGAGELLPGLNYDDCPDLDDWLTAERERFLEWRGQALHAELLRLERAGDYGGALNHARRLLDLDPVSEEAHRHLMRLHYLRGDRPAALRAYHRCQEVLRREFDVDPLPETVQLARQIDQLTLPPPTPREAGRTIPLSLLRPPSLVGREREWAQMEAAWARGQVIVLAGPPGVGKSRLAQEFLAARGPYASVEARPGDRQVPYATITRAWREFLAAHPDLSLPDWAREELARLFPEFGPPPPPLASPEQKLRFFEAGATLVWATRSLFSGQLYDDVQYIDAASAELGAYMVARLPGAGGDGLPPRLIFSYREGELPAETAQMLEALVDAGQAVRVEVRPLEGADQAAFVAGLGVELPATLGASLIQYTGGNPLLMLETLRHLAQTDQLGAHELRAEALPPRVRDLMGRRLDALSPLALGAARAAAVLQRDFDVELVAEMLGAPLLDLLSAWEELEAAQVMQGERFSHDLVLENVRAGVPASLRPLLHRGAAKALERQEAHPARIAQHWLEGGKPALAAPQWRRAAELAQARYLNATAAQNLAQAAEAHRAAGEPDAAFQALHQRAVTLGHLEDRAARDAALAELFAAAQGPSQRAQAWQLLSDLHSAYHEGPESEDAARRGLAELEAVTPGTGAQQLRANLEASMGAALWVQGRMAEAADTLRRAVAAHEALGDSPDLAANLSNLGVILDHLERHREATVYHRRACQGLERAGMWSDLNAALSNLAVSLLDQGEAASALSAAQRANALLEQADGGHAGAMLGHLNTGQICHALGHFERALAHYQQAEGCAREGTWHAGFIPTLRADTLLLLGDLEGAERALERSLGLATMPPAYRARTLAARADLALLRGEPAGPWLEEAESQLGPSPRPFLRGRLGLLRAQLLSPEEALTLVLEVVELARASDLGGLEIAARVRAAQTLLRLGRVPEALDQLHQAEALLSTLEPAVITRGEALLTLAQALGAAGDPRAAELAAQARRWLRETGDGQVPAEYARSWLTHPVHAAIAAQEVSAASGQRRP